MELEQHQGLELDRARCLERLNWAVHQLGGKIDPRHQVRITDLIIQTMTGPWRFFHTPGHIFEVGESGDAVEVIAALFHDLVYVQVDQGVSVNISRYIAPFVKEIYGQLVILEAEELPADPVFEMVRHIFGFVPGQALQPTCGQNEFLSALIAGRCLEPALPLDILTEIAACIEATIPFRPRSMQTLPTGQSSLGQTAADHLYNRLAQVSQTFGFGWSDSDLIYRVRRAIRVANRDVENFAFPCSADFLDNTWNLLPETNHDLTHANSYTVYGYRRSLEKMAGFMEVLKPDLVFQRYQDEPDEQTYQQLLIRTQHNLEVARLYLGSKLLSIAVIEALSLRIGREIPLATMMGELPFLGCSLAQLENFLPTVNTQFPPETTLEWEVMDLLEKGRSQASSYDIKNSPVATFIIKSIGFPAARQLLEEARAFFHGSLSAEDFLARCDRPIVEPICHAVQQVFESRKVAICSSSVLRQT